MDGYGSLYHDDDVDQEKDVEGYTKGDGKGEQCNFIYKLDCLSG